MVGANTQTIGVHISMETVIEIQHNVQRNTPTLWWGYEHEEAEMHRFIMVVGKFLIAAGVTAFATVGVMAAVCMAMDWDEGEWMVSLFLGGIISAFLGCVTCAIGEQLE
ncbi:MAG: hypothetical protein WC291_00180 [Thermodesulfovibrionales bacterium]|jgi:hypothetical protein